MELYIAALSLINIAIVTYSLFITKEREIERESARERERERETERQTERETDREIFFPEQCKFVHLLYRVACPNFGFLELTIKTEHEKKNSKAIAISKLSLHSQFLN